MFTQSNGQSLIEQKRLQWAREREEMVGLSGLWGTLDKSINAKPLSTRQVEPRRNSLLPPLQPKSDEFKDKAEESETSGYISDSPQHESDSSVETRSSVWSAANKRENYWEDQKVQKNLRNECRLRGTPDSLLSTPEDRMKWGDRGVGVGHLWEPVVEMPDSRLPQVFEAYRATPRWVERGLKLSDGNKADILVIEHEGEEKLPKGNYLLGQNVPVPPEILEERERKRKKALEHQNAIMKQLEERERKRKEDKENKIREERLEEERIAKERERERLRQEEETRKIKEKENVEKIKEEAMKNALEQAAKKAREEKKKLKKRESFETVITPNSRLAFDEKPLKVESSKRSTPRIDSAFASEITETCKETKDSSCQAEDNVSQTFSNSSVQSDTLSGLQFLNVGNVADGSLALVLDNNSPGGILVPQDAVQLLLMSPGHVSLPAPPFQRPERVLTPSKLRMSRSLADATTQTSGKCCSLSLNSFRSRRGVRMSGRTSGRSDSSDKSNSLERIHSHSHCLSSSFKLRARSQPRLPIVDRPKWGINRPTVQYLKQSEKDPHYGRRVKRRPRRVKEGIHTDEKLLESEFRLLTFQTDEEIDKRTDVEEDNVLKNGFRMVSNPSSPRFVPINNPNKNVCSNDDFEVMLIEDIAIDNVNSQIVVSDKCPPKAPLEQENLTQVENDSNESLSPVFQPNEDGESTSGVESMELLQNSFDNSASNSGRSESLTHTLVSETNLKEENDGDSYSFDLDLLGEEVIEVTSVEAKAAEMPDTIKTEGNEKVTTILNCENDDDDEDNNSVVSASLLVKKRNLESNLDALAQIAALKLGLERLHEDLDSSECPSPEEINSPRINHIPNPL